MTPKEGFYANPSPETLVVARKWEEVKQPIVYYEKKKPRIRSHLYPGEIITANGHHLLGAIKLSSRTVDAGVINIPFGIWGASKPLEIEEQLVEKAREMGVLELLDKKNDFEKLDILGLGSTPGSHNVKISTGGSFFYTISRDALEVIRFFKISGSKEIVLKGGRPANGVRVEGLVQDFIDAFPGWQIQPMFL